MAKTTNVVALPHGIQVISDALILSMGICQGTEQVLGVFNIRSRKMRLSIDMLALS
jgi:hypothetical protein